MLRTGVSPSARTFDAALDALRNLTSTVAGCTFALRAMPATCLGEWRTGGRCGAFFAGVLPASDAPARTSGNATQTTRTIDRLKARRLPTTLIPFAGPLPYEPNLIESNPVSTRVEEGRKRVCPLGHALAGGYDRRPRPEHRSLDAQALQLPVDLDH